MMDDDKFESDALKDLEGQMEALSKKAANLNVPDMPKPSHEMDAQLEDLEKRAAEHRKKSHAERDFIYRDERGAKNFQDTGRHLSTGLAAAYAIMGGPMVGYGLGWLLDRATGSNMWGALLMILGAVVGIAFTVKIVNDRDQRK